MKRRIIYFVLLTFLLTDIGYSFVQHLNQTLDGDMGWNLVPSPEVEPVLANPLGIEAIMENKTYSNPNRFFCHWTFKEYLVSTPLLLQSIMEPIDSVYWACAIAKILIQVLLIILLASIISGTLNIAKLEFIIAAVLVTPFFQTNGYRDYMGIIDPSTTYTFFYALPCAIILLYFVPFIFKYYHLNSTQMPLLLKILWIPFAFVVCLSGPLNPGAVLIFSLLVILPVLINSIRKSNHSSFINGVKDAFLDIPKDYWFYLTPVCILSLYSLFLGSYNSITIVTKIPLSEMYSRIPEGIVNLFTNKLGFPILFAMLIINGLIIEKVIKNNEGKKILNIFKWIGVFAIIYILLLPLGGYRTYRPNILRFDTIMPITLALIFAFGISTLYIIKSISQKQLKWYLPIIILVLFIYTNADKPGLDKNDCEREALMEIVRSKESIVALPYDCSVLDWGKIAKPEHAILNTQLLKIWRVTKEEKLYYNK